ncbi:hypothetical protein ACEWY4_020895 [Coilia grayii]|uniref:Domain of unknown function with conserved HDNR motif domain-containing protein n=1 Tax=Coilia grayii TaxID=363190 RepID=A0ABD1J7F6_9TELE
MADSCHMVGMRLCSKYQGEGHHPSAPTNGTQRAEPQQFPYSAHDNRSSLLHSIHLFDGGLGRKKCVDGRRQHNSHFCLCHVGLPASGARSSSTYQSDFLPREEVEVTQSRRFPRSHRERSNMAVAEPKNQERPLWFGRHDDTHTRTPLHVLAAVTNCSARQSR